MEKQWPLYEAKNRFSHLVDSAMKGNIQSVTKHGKEVAVLISAAEYRKLIGKKNQKSIKDFLLSGPNLDEDLGVDRGNSNIRDIDL